MRRIVGGALAALAVATAGAVGAATAQAAPTGNLYVLQAASASLQRSGAGWRLVLRHPDRAVATFADRPVRRGSTQRLARFVAGWHGAFGSDAPNAALELPGAPASRDVALLELSRPRYDRAGDRLVLRARSLTSTTSKVLGGFARRADHGLHGTLGRASLFIDDGDPTTDAAPDPPPEVISGEWATCQVDQHTYTDETRHVKVWAYFLCSRIERWGAVRSVVRWNDGSTDNSPWFGADQVNKEWRSGDYVERRESSRRVSSITIEQGPIPLGLDVPQTEVALGGSPGRLTATLPKGATGTVTFFDSSETGGAGIPLGTVAIVDGVAVLDPAPFTYAGLNRLWAFWRDPNGVVHNSVVVDVMVR